VCYHLNRNLSTGCCIITKNADFNAYQETLAVTPWSLVEADDIDSWWTQWKDLFFGAVNDVVPQIKWKRHKMKSWLSGSTIKLIRLKKSYIIKR